MIDRKTNLLLMALDEATFTVVKRQLTDAERADYDTVKKHLLKRFDLLKDAGQKRLIFRQARREYGQTIKEFYTVLLGMAAKAFPGESSATVDRMILDQLICGCAEEKVLMHLIEKSPITSREALSIAVAYKAAIKYNESLRESTKLVSSMHNENDQKDYSNTCRRSMSRNYHNRRVRSRERDYEDDDRRNSYNQKDKYERGEDNRENSNNVYFNKRRSEDYCNTRTQANFQKRGGADFKNDRQVNRIQMRRNYERIVSPEWGKKNNYANMLSIHQIFIT